MHQLVHFKISFEKGKFDIRDLQSAETPKKSLSLLQQHQFALLRRKSHTALFTSSPSTRHSLHPCVGVFSFYGFELSYMHFLPTRGGNTLHRGQPLNFARRAFMQQQFMHKSNLQLSASSNSCYGCKKSVWKLKSMFQRRSIKDVQMHLNVGC